MRLTIYIRKRDYINAEGGDALTKIIELFSL